jgi:photosystem II stability/assembly factor-like uncharacterized protein
MRIVLIVGTEKGAFVCTSNRERSSWEIRGPEFKGWKVTASGRSPSGRWFLSTASQVYGAAIHTGTDLQRWHQIERGPAYPEGGDRKLNQIWTMHCGPDRHYAGVDTAGLFASDDDGESWQPVSALNDHRTRPSWFPGAGGLCAHSVLVDPARPERLWVGISAVGVWRSDDRGKSWQAKNDGVRNMAEDKEHPEIGFCVHGLALDPTEPNRLYRQDHSGMYRSRDGGDTWEVNDAGLPSWGFGFPIAIDPHTRTLFSFPLESDEYRLPVDGQCRVYRSRDGGDSWEPTSRGLPGNYYATVLRGGMAVDALDPAGVYIGSTSGDLFASSDGGESWQTLPCRLPRILNVKAYVEA